MTLGEIIKNYRIDHSMSMDVFAKNSGISKAYISLLEKNKHPKTGKEITPSIPIIKQAAFCMGMDFDTLFAMLDKDYTISMAPTEEEKDSIKDIKNAFYPRRIPVLGRVAAGIPIEMIEDIVDEEEIPGDMVGEYFGLRIKGDSMEPKISEGDTVIVRQQPDVENTEIAIVTINGQEATCKRVYKYAETLVLRSDNPKYGEYSFTKEEVEKLPVRILGKVVELRAKF